MSKPSIHRSSRGYSLTEMAIVVTLASIISAVAVPSLRAMARNTALRSAARELAGSLHKARSIVMTGRQDFAGWGTDDSTESAGVRFLNDTSYVVFADRDDRSNGTATEAIVRSATLETPMKFVAYPAEIRFKRNGTLSSTAQDLLIVVEDVESGARRTVRVAFGGKADLL